MSMEHDYMSRDDRDELPPLTPEQSSAMIREMHAALIGKPLDPNAPPGLVRRVEKLDAAIEGTTEEPLGIRAKTRILWDSHTKFVAVAGCIGALAGILGWALPLILKSIGIVH